MVPQYYYSVILLQGMDFAGPSTQNPCPLTFLIYYTRTLSKGEIEMCQYLERDYTIVVDGANDLNEMCISTILTRLNNE